MVVVCVRAWCQFCHSRHWDWLWLYAWWLNVSMITSWLFFSRFDKSIFVRWFCALRLNKEFVHIDSNTCEWIRILHRIRASRPVNNESNDSKRVEPIKMKWKFSDRCCHYFRALIGACALHVQLVPAQNFEQVCANHKFVRNDNVLDLLEIRMEQTKTMSKKVESILMRTRSNGSKRPAHSISVLRLVAPLCVCVFLAEGEMEMRELSLTAIQKLCVQFWTIYIQIHAVALHYSWSRRLCTANSFAAVLDMPNNIA